MEGKTLYTVTIFSENTVGVLNQITTIFTRRQLNIETLSVSPRHWQGYTSSPSPSLPSRTR